MTVAVHKYPTKAEITRVVEAARALKIAVGGIEVRPDGTIRVVPASSNVPETAFDQWKSHRRNE